MKAAIVGAGTYGQVYLAYLREQACFTIVGFLDDDEKKLGTEHAGLPVFATSDDFSEMRRRSIGAVFAPIDHNKRRSEILARSREEGFDTPRFIHLTALISPEVTLGIAVYVLPMTVVMPHTRLDDYVMLSAGVKIAHHTHVKKGSFVSEGANVGAGITIDEYAYLGTGCTIKTGVKTIGREALIGTGAVVIRDVPECTTVAGVPAKPLQPHSRPTVNIY